MNPGSRYSNSKVSCRHYRNKACGRTSGVAAPHSWVMPSCVSASATVLAMIASRKMLLNMLLVTSTRMRYCSIMA